MTPDVMGIVLSAAVIAGTAVVFTLAVWDMRNEDRRHNTTEDPHAQDPADLEE